MTARCKNYLRPPARNAGAGTLAARADAARELLFGSRIKTDQCGRRARRISASAAATSSMTSTTPRRIHKR